MMCYGCWVEEGKLAVMSDAVLKAAPLIRAADDCGAMHIVVSDWNLDDDHIEFCKNYETATPEDVVLCDLMAAMTYDERLSAMALADGYIDETGKERGLA
jgi:hypothetical protein